MIFESVYFLSFLSFIFSLMALIIISNKRIGIFSLQKLFYKCEERLISSRGLNNRSYSEGVNLFDPLRPKRPCCFLDPQTPESRNAVSQRGLLYAIVNKY